MFEFEVSLESSIRLARKYLFYLSFFAILYYIQDIADIKKFLFIFIALAVCCSSLFYTQFFVGSRFKIMRYLLMDYQQLGGFYILRIYLAGSTPLLCLSFAICFWLTQCYTTQKKVRVFLILSFFLGIALFLCFSRARWVMQFLIIAVPFFFATKYEKAKTLKLTLITACIGFIILIVAQAVGVDFLTHLTKLIQRIESTYYEIIHQTGTFGYRLEDSFQRINMFLKRPLLGVGFLHHLAALESPKAAFVKDYLVETIDSGLITLLVTMGLGGVAVFSIVLIGFFTRSIKIIRVNNSPLLRGICLGCLGYIAGATLTFITLPCFTSLNEIPYITLAFALVEKVSQFNTPEE
ncbi:MAG: O-antigen ligase family protein [bacterium]|nr:O-antigen ligase family protein [bacterium]